ncbi:HAD-IIB family hydrolase [Mesorhizobium neociceri]|uniref:HAD-IIB family hydrolase n=1 Tax=Mesorhizobium neociceri TaxID=1307853 RepID=UPI001F23B062|nr:HAD-IIB family hydrolase [Mesorhizobium neociceri]
MRPLADFTALDRRNIAVVLTDIDDTLTDKGRLPAKAYAALERLKQAGFIVTPVTGRPAGWCDLIARQWPVDGVIGENGAFYFRYDDAKKRIVRHYAKSAAERQADAARLKEIEQTVLREVPGAAVAADQAYREADLAIDFCEDVAPLPKTEVLKIVGIFQRYGATAKISSIHVNGWFGKYDKLSTSRLFLRDCFGIDIDHDKDSIVFVGDSPNDAPMFGFFPNSVGVANVLDFAGELPASPAFVTSGRGAEGFAELADALIAAKGME